jgi:hypothetical protein
MVSLTTAGGNRQVIIILVTYYTHDIYAAKRLIDDFCYATELACIKALIVDNSGTLVSKSCDVGSDYLVIAGDNQFWEFSGWSLGLRMVGMWTKPPCIVMLNDSYGRNWSVSPLSRFFISRMYMACLGGQVAGWLDNFSHFRPPRFSRRPNSRILFVPTAAVPAVQTSINKAILLLQQRTSTKCPLFSPEEQNCIERWIASHRDRWDSKTLLTRVQRIFLEHRMLDSLPPGLVSWFPKTWLGSINYAILRRLIGERR